MYNIVNYMVAMSKLQGGGVMQQSGTHLEGCRLQSSAIGEGE